MTLPAALTGCNVSQSLLRAEPTQNFPALDAFGLTNRDVERTLGILAGNAANIADLYLQHRVTNRVEFLNGEQRDSASDVIRGAGLRSVVGDKTLFASTEALDGESLAATAATLVGIVDSERPALRAAESPTTRLYLSTGEIADAEFERKLEILRRLERLIRDADSTVTDVAIRWMDEADRIVIANERGELVSDERPMTSLTVTVTAERGGRVRSGFASTAARDGFDWYSDERLSRIADQATARANILFDAKQAPEGDMPVILAAGASGVVLHEALAHSFEADFVREGQSPFADRVGEQVAPEAVTLVDRATIPNARGALHVDDEGVEPETNTLIENGVLRGFLHDRQSALAFGERSTGSGRRESYRFPPLPRASCTYISNGDSEPDEITAAVERGILCESYVGGEVSADTGEFRFRVHNAWLIENGRKTFPVSGVDIVGRGEDLLNGIAMVGDDLALDSGGWACVKKGQDVPVSEGMPTVLVNGLSVRT